MQNKQIRDLRGSLSWFGVRVTRHRFVRCRPGDIQHSLEVQQGRYLEYQIIVG